MNADCDTKTGAEPVEPAATWARRLQRGEPEAVREVRRRVGKTIAHGALSIPVQEQEDLKQEITTEIWQAVNRSGFDVTLGFWGFVELVTSRRCIDWLRRRREQTALPDDLAVATGGPFKRTLHQERATLATEILTQLKPACRRLIQLRFRDELSYAEISGRLDRSEGALRVQLYRCIRSAQKILERSGELRKLTGDRRGR